MISKDCPEEMGYTLRCGSTVFETLKKIASTQGYYVSSLMDAMLKIAMNDPDLGGKLKAMNLRKKPNPQNTRIKI